MPIFVDPPRGWLYGFPKEMPKDVTNMFEWLISEGYPQKEIDALGQYFHVRQWEAPSENTGNP